MIRRPPRSTRMTHSFPTRRSSDLGDGVVERGLGVHHAHAAAAAAAGGLDDHRIADLATDREVGIAVVAQRAAAAWHAWHAGGLHRADRLDLVAHQADGLGLGPDEDEAEIGRAPD